MSDTKTELTVVDKPKLPTLTQLYEDKELTLKESALAQILNAPPKKDWVLQHPMLKTDYLPVNRVEWLLNNIFGKWHLEIKNTQLIANSVVVTVRLHYRDPITSEMLWMDGIGAAPLQVNSGSSPTDWTQVKGAAVQMAAPIAESMAFKDSAAKLGNIFGKDLNRKQQITHEGIMDKFAKDEHYSNLLGEGGSK
jgi:hypothetical protein